MLKPENANTANGGETSKIFGQCSPKHLTKVMKNLINSICFLHGLVQPPTFHRDFSKPWCFTMINNEVVSWKLVAKGCEVVVKIAVAMRSFGARLGGKSGCFLEPGIPSGKLTCSPLKMDGWNRGAFPIG